MTSTTQETIRALNVARAVLLFHDGNVWNADKATEWDRLTGDEPATTHGLCNAIRSALPLLDALAGQIAAKDAALRLVWNELTGGTQSGGLVTNTTMCAIHDALAGTTEVPAGACVSPSADHGIQPALPVTDEAQVDEPVAWIPNATLRKVMQSDKPVQVWLHRRPDAESGEPRIPLYTSLDAMGEGSPDPDAPSPSEPETGGAGEWRETFRSCGIWADETFGPATVLRRLERAQEELHEAKQATHSTVMEEIADVVICLAAAAHSFGGDLQAAIDAKMAVNRKRQWSVRGDGTGYHIKPDAAPQVRP